MSDPTEAPPRVPPDIARYLRGATQESLQFDFLIGDWQVAGTRFKEDGSPLAAFKASWAARYLSDKRMVMDEFKAYAPGGQEISSFVTLRTYSEATRRWELQGLAALQPAAPLEWFGGMQDGEMLLEAIGKGPDGRTVRNKIRFFEIASDRFRWESRLSLDDGKSWTLNVAMTAARVVK